MYTQTMTAVYNSLKKKGFSNEDFDKWLLNPNIRKLYPQAALDVISTMWYSAVLKPKSKPKKKKPAAKPLDSFKYFNENEQE